MEFLHPHFLYGLFAIAIPILVHLFNFRRYKKVFFSNVQMLQSIHKKTKKQSQLKHLIVLLLRILAIVAAVLAFAQPIIPNTQSEVSSQGRQYVSIYLDNSFSMTHIGENGTLLNEAQNKALSILDSYQNTDYFHLITNDMFGRHHRWFNKMEMSQNMMEVQAVHLQQALERVFQREAMLREQSAIHQKAVLYLLSDFQKSMKFTHQMAKDTNLLVRLIPLQNNPVNNISIDSLWFEHPVQLPQTVSRIHIKLNNSSPQKQTNIPLRLFINDEQKAVLSVDLDARKTEVFSLSFTNKTAGNFKGKVEIDDYPIIFDDHFYFTFKVRDLFKVSVISENTGNPYLHQLFANDSMIEWHTYQSNNIDYQRIKQQDLIILNEIETLKSGLKKELEQYLNTGGQVLLIPKGAGDLRSINKWLSSLKVPPYSDLDTVAIRIQEIDKQLGFYDRVFDKQFKYTTSNQKVDLPIIKKFYPIRAFVASDKLLRTEGGKVVLSSTNVQEGKLYQLAMPLNTEYSQLPEHALFVAVFYQMIMQTQDQKKLYETVGSSNPINIIIPKELSGQLSDEVLHIRKGETDWIPEIRRTNKNDFQLVNIQWPTEGVFDVYYKKQKVEQIAVNYSRAESDFSIWEPEELLNEIATLELSNFQILNTSTQQLSSKIIQLDHGISLWKWFILLTILFIFVETMILRLWK